MTGANVLKLSLAFLLSGAIGGAATVWQMDKATGRGNGRIVHEEASPPKIDRIRKLASLVALDVPISHVQRSRLSGVTGSTAVVVVAVGEVRVSTNLEKARFSDVDRKERRATLSLPQPTVGEPRLDQERTKVFKAQRTGLWAVLPGDAGEATLIDAAMADAQKRLAEHAKKKDLVGKARAHTEKVLSDFLAGLGWEVTFDWRSPASAKSSS